jgi:hypothetical protein
MESVEKQILERILEVRAHDERARRSLGLSKRAMAKNN